MTAAAMVAEFDDVAGWTADAVEQLGRPVRHTGRLPWQRESGRAGLAGRGLRAVGRDQAAGRGCRCRRSGGLGGRAVRGTADSAGTDAGRGPGRRPAVRAAGHRRGRSADPAADGLGRCRLVPGGAVHCRGQGRGARRDPPGAEARCLPGAPGGRCPRPAESSGLPRATTSRPRTSSPGCSTVLGSSSSSRPAARMPLRCPGRGESSRSTPSSPRDTAGARLHTGRPPRRALHPPVRHRVRRTRTSQLTAVDRSTRRELRPPLIRRKSHRKDVTIGRVVWS